MPEAVLMEGQDAPQSPMSGGGAARVYVGNLAWRVKWQDLKDHMRRVGDVKFVEVMDDHQGRSRGCAIVEYSTPEEAQRAIVELHDTTLMDRKIFVREDREDRRVGGRRPAGPAAHQQGGSAGGVPMARYREPAEGRQLHVSNLPWKISWQDLKDLFGGQELVERADVMTEPSGRSRGFGFVVMRTEEAAQEAIERLNGQEFSGRNITVKLDSGPPSGGAGGRRFNNRD